MGLFRKMTSISTLGLVDFRSDKERTAAYTRASARQARKQTAIMRRQARAAEQPAWGPSDPKKREAWMIRQQAGMVTAAPTPPPAGWYPDPSGQPVQRWWDGTRWTEHTQPQA